MIEVTFLGTGPTEPVVGKGKSSRTRSSTLISLDGFTVLIDVSPDFGKQIKKAKIGYVDAVLLTHAHKDAIGGIPQLIAWTKEPIPVYCESETWSTVRKRFERLDRLSHIDTEPYKTFKLGDFKVTPFRVEHSIQPGFPTVGYRIDGLVYAEDLGRLPDPSLPYVANAEMLVLDAAMWFGKFIKGHLSVDQAIKLAVEWKAKSLYLIQAGHTYPAYETAAREIQKYAGKIGAKLPIKLTYDGMQISGGRTESLSENREGLYLVEPHAKWIWMGEKKMIIKARLYEGMLNKPLYLLGDGKAYGIIRLKPPRKIGLIEFHKLISKHKIGDMTRKKWWKDTKKFYAYEFGFEKFEEPKKVAIPQGAQVFVKDFKFLSEHEPKPEELIRDIAAYDPAKLATDILKGDFRTALAWYASKKEGKEVKHSVEEILNLIAIISKELGKRGVELRPDEMAPAAAEGFRRATEGKPLALNYAELEPSQLCNLDDSQLMELLLQNDT